jgi:hypothetical protein
MLLKAEVLKYLMTNTPCAPNIMIISKRFSEALLKE